MEASAVEQASTDGGGGCEGAAGMSLERVELSLNSSQQLASGLELHYVGTSEDLYEDGSFDLLAEFRFRWGSQDSAAIVSALAASETAELGPTLAHCWRFVGITDAGAVVDIAMAPADTKLEPCAATAEDLPVFDSFERAAPGARFEATLRYDGQAHQWEVSPQPQLLHHHASRIAWSNLAGFGRAGLGLARDQLVRVSFRIDAIEVAEVRERELWTSEYQATLLSACLPVEP